MPGLAVAGHPYVKALNGTETIFGYPGGSAAPKIGRVGTSKQWIAAVPLDSNGTMGLSSVLLYLPGARTYLANFGGGRPMFRNGHIFIIHRWHMNDECNACDTHNRIEELTFEAGALHTIADSVVTNAFFERRYQ